MTDKMPRSSFRAQMMTGQVIVVTGAAQGIGRATVLRLAELGAHIAALDIDAEQLDALEKELSSHGASFACFCGDVSDEPFLKDAVRSIERTWGRLSGWVNCAYATHVRPLSKQTAEQFRHVWEVNVHAAWHAAKLTAPLMAAEEAGGAIVNVSSVLAHRARTGSSAYLSTKGAIEAMSRALAYELAPSRVRVNTVIPGAIDTGPHRSSFIKWHAGDRAPEQQAMAEEMFEKLYRNTQPLPHVGVPVDVADPIVFLLSDAARFITGATLAVDGGFLIDGTPMVDHRSLNLMADYKNFRESLGLPPGPPPWRKRDKPPADPE